MLGLIILTLRCLNVDNTTNVVRELSDKLDGEKLVITIIDRQCKILIIYFLYIEKYFIDDSIIFCAVAIQKY